MQEPLVLLHFSFLFHSFSVYKSAHDSGLHLLSYNTVLISGTIIRTFPELPGDKPIHLVLIQILGTDIVLIILIIFVIHTVFTAGTGTFLLLSLTRLAHMDIRTASGNVKLINLSSNIAALFTFLCSGYILYAPGLAGAAFCLAGHYIGSGMVMKNGTKIVRPIIIVVLILLFIKVISGN